MKNKQRGFIGIVAIILIALVVVGGGAYVYTKGKNVNVNINTQVVSTDEVDTKNATQATTSTQVDKKAQVNISVPQIPVKKDDLVIVKPSGDVIWQMGVPQTLEWNLNIDLNAIKGDIAMKVSLKDTSGKIIPIPVGQIIKKEANGSATISIPYYENIQPGKYKLVLDIYSNIVTVACSDCENQSNNVVASATTNGWITITPASANVRPVITSQNSTKVKVGDTFSVKGVAFTSESKVLIQKHESNGYFIGKIAVSAEVTSSTDLKFVVPKGCSSSDNCIPENGKITPGLYYISIQTVNGESNVSPMVVID